MTVIRDLFASDVTRDIPPVVYFHEQSPEKLKSEVTEYIITGGWPEDHPNHRRVPNGIHEQYVRLLTGIASELDKKGGPELPAAWISGFYGSGKSSFAKLLGLALDGVTLPDGTALAKAWLDRDTSPRREELKEAWATLRERVDPIAVVFDVGSTARDQEHVHAAALRQVQRRLGYCSTEPLVASYELKLERDGHWKRFLETAEEVLGQPWDEVKDRQLAEDDFSLVLSKLYPDHYEDPMAWISSRAGMPTGAESPEEAVKAIRDMLQLRSPGTTLFLVVDEVSQYVLGHKDRVDRLRAFATALGANLKGKAWLLALGQQKLDEQAGDSFLVWAKDRFPQKLQVHLHATNIRDVVHKRLLQKKPEAEATLRDLFERHRPDLKLYAYGCEDATPSQFVETYPMLPGQMDLVLQVTSALRTRSSRAQGDDQAIRGLLQLLGELFRDQKLADGELGRLVTLDQIYEVQHTALDSDIQGSMARVLEQCSDEKDALLVRAAKAVALLELIQETEPTTAKLVAQCLYDRVDRGNTVPAVTEALEELRRRNLLGYSEKTGYKIQSSAGEEWERERRDIGVSREQITDVVGSALKQMLGTPERPKLQGRPFPWAAVLSDGRRLQDSSLVDPRDEAAFRVDFRFLAQEDRGRTAWVKRSDETALKERLVWVVGDTQEVDEVARNLQRSRAMIRKYEPRRESLSSAKKVQLLAEKDRCEDLERRVLEVIASAWMAGQMYFRGLAIEPSEHGAAFGTALNGVATKLLDDLYPHFVATQIQPAELAPLLQAELSGPSPKFLESHLGILELDGGRYVPACSGVVVRRVHEFIENEGGVTGTALLARFGGPPFGYTPGVVRACVAGLLRASKLRIQPEGGSEITAIRDAGVRDLFEKDRAFRRATTFPAGDDDIGVQARNRICKFFEQQLSLSLDREDHAIADAVSTQFPGLTQMLRGVQSRLDRLPGPSREPKVFEKLAEVLENGVKRCRQTKPTVQLIKKQLDVLRDGVPILRGYDSELNEAAIASVREAYDLLEHQGAQLRALGVFATNLDAAEKRLGDQLVSERPWQDITTCADDVEAIRAAYRAEREAMIANIGERADEARARVKRRQGFSTLSADESNRVLRPISKAIPETTVEAIAPTLVDLRERFEAKLRTAEEEANEILDEILSSGEKPIIQKVNLELRNREIATEEDVNALIEDIRKRLLEKVRSGVRVRLL